MTTDNDAEEHARRMAIVSEVAALAPDHPLTARAMKAITRVCTCGKLMALWQPRDAEVAVMRCMGCGRMEER